MGKFAITRLTEIVRACLFAKIELLGILGKAFLEVVKNEETKLKIHKVSRRIKEENLC